MPVKDRPHYPVDASDFWLVTHQYEVFGGLVLWVYDGTEKRTLYVVDWASSWIGVFSRRVTIGFAGLDHMASYYDGPEILKVTYEAFPLKDPEEIIELMRSVKEDYYNVVTYSWNNWRWNFDTYLGSEITSCQIPGSRILQTMQRVEDICFFLGGIREENLSPEQVELYAKELGLELPIWYVDVDLRSIRFDEKNNR